MNIVTKSYESLLPFLVVEAISAQGVSFNSMSVRMIDKGWAWLVSGRKLLIWKFKDSKSPSVAKTRRMLSPCFELQLPQSDLIHKAELISIFFMPQNPNTSLRAITVPAALVISPEGTIRFWSNIANERFTESTVPDMQGQEFCTLAYLSCLEYLVGTTTGSVFVLSIDITAYDPKNIIICTPLNAPSGLLSGIGRRVTNLFFGPMNADIGTDTRRPLLTVPKYSQSTVEKTGSTDRPFYIMSSSFRLRQWSRTNEGVNSSNQMLREWDLHRGVYVRLASKLHLSESDNLSFWPVDMITTKSKELLILIVVLDMARNNRVNYTTCVFNPYQAGDVIGNLTFFSSHSWNYSNESEDQLLALRFLERRATTPLCFMYDRKFLFLVQVNQDILDAIDYGNQDDGILGAGILDNHPILFTQRDGLTCVMPVACDQSRLDETSMQFEPSQHPANTSVKRPQQQSTNRRPETSVLHSVSTRSNKSAVVEPMLIEIDVEDDQEDVENKNSVSVNQSRRRTDKDQSNVNNSINNSTLSNPADNSMQRRDEATEKLKSSKEFEWVQQIDSRQYSCASETLAKLAGEADDNELLEGRKETLLALSKLAKLAE